MIPDNDTTADGQGYRDIYAMASSDNGLTWSAPVNLTQTIDKEESFPSAAKLVGTNIHIVYQEDYEPGTELTNSDPGGAANDIMYLQVPANAIWNGDIGFNEYKKNQLSLENYPNPFIGSTTIEVKIGTPSNINFSVMYCIFQLKYFCPRSRRRFCSQN